MKARLYRALGAHLVSILLVLVLVPGSACAEAVRVKDLGKLQGWRDNALNGFGIVTGLAGTGDTPNNRAARQAMSNALAQSGLQVPADQMQNRNVALVMVSAALPTFAREGDRLDVTVTSIGDARSLNGGNLAPMPLKGANGVIYALAQGALSTGSYRYDANGNMVQKNHPTAGLVPNGAIVEVGVSAQMLSADGKITFVLTEADYTTADRVANAVNAQMGEGLARAHDAAGIDIAVPQDQAARLVDFVTRLEAVTLEPDRRAKVVVDERTGTIVAGADVRISPVVLTQGDMKLDIRSQTTASQPLGVVGPFNNGVRTAVVTNSQISAEEKDVAGFVASNNSVADLVQSLALLKTSTRDIISILRAVKALGALHAELIIQ